MGAGSRALDSRVPRWCSRRRWRTRSSWIDSRGPGASASAPHATTARWAMWHEPRGIDTDVRRDHPLAAYGGLEFRVPLFESGDVKARTSVPLEDAREAVRLIRQAVDRLPAGALASPLGRVPLFEPAFGLVEGWRGAIIHWVMADRTGRHFRVKIMDASFLNWRPRSYALLKNIVPDFPLCDKSFHQSYSGNDL